jgi:dGTP triphosphohydrolase
LSRREWNRFFDAVCEQTDNGRIKQGRSRFEDALRDALGLVGLDGPFVGSQQQNSTVWQFSSELISHYVNAIKLVDPVESKDGRCVEIGSTAGDQTTILKQLTWHYVIRRSDLATLQHGQKATIGALFDVYNAAIHEEKWELFPVGFAQLIRSSRGVPAARWAADYISGLTERQVIGLHRRLGGHSLASLDS